MKNALIIICLVCTYFLAEARDYTFYHEKIIGIEWLIADEKFEDALRGYEQLFEAYDFIFIRDYKNALQLAGYLGNQQSGEPLLERSIRNGLSLKSVRRNKWISKVYQRSNTTKKTFKSWQEVYESKIRSDTRNLLKSMHSKNQWKAIGALLRIGNGAQDNYGEKKFAAFSISQLHRLHQVIDSVGYPSEQLIGNNYWATSIVSHHNSISQKFVAEDSLYPGLISPLLRQELTLGRISPYEIAEMEDWKYAVETGHAMTKYGFLGRFELKDIEEIDNRRLYLGLRSIGLRNQLVAIEKAYGFDFSLPGKAWHKGIIEF